MLMKVNLMYKIASSKESFDVEISMNNLIVKIGIIVDL